MKPINILRILVAACILGAGVYWHENLNKEKQRAHEEASLWANLLAAMEETHTGLLKASMKNGGRFTIESANDSACDIFGYLPGEMDGMDVAMLLPVWFQEAHEVKMRMAQHHDGDRTTKGRVSDMRCVAVRRDHERIDVLVRVLITPDSVIALINKADEVRHSVMGSEGVIDEDPQTPHPYPLRAP